MSVLEFLPEAFTEAAAAVAYYEEREQGLGARLRAEIETASAAILDHPLLWRERRGGYRRVNLPAFPFYLAYFIRGKRVIIAALGHASRHPDYWKVASPRSSRSTNMLITPRNWVGSDLGKSRPARAMRS